MDKIEVFVEEWRGFLQRALFRINGHDLRELLGDYSYAGIETHLILPPEQHLIGRPNPDLQAEAFWFADDAAVGNKVPVLGCGSCGVGCFAVIASIDVSNDTVKWYDFDASSGGRPRGHEYPDVGPFCFYRKEYETELRKHSTWVNSPPGFQLPDISR